MLWHLEIHPSPGHPDLAGKRLSDEPAESGLPGPWSIAVLDMATGDSLSIRSMDGYFKPDEFKLKGANKALKTLQDSCKE